MTNSKQKGKRGELEAARELTRLLGVEYRRSQQYMGTADSADIIPVNGANGLHFEVKRTEKLRVYEFIEQAVADCGSLDIPIVLHKQNSTSAEPKPWLAIIRLDDLPQLAVTIFHILSSDDDQPTEES